VSGSEPRDRAAATSPISATRAGEPHADATMDIAAAAAHCFVDRLDSSITVDGPDGHHLQRVRRLRTGELLTAADGDGRWRRYVIAGVEPGRLLLRADSDVVVEPELEPAVAVAVALTKGTKLETVVAQLTELGVVRIEPVRARRSVVRWSDDRAEAAVARLRMVAREAAMQCRRARVPEISPIADLASLAGRSGLVVASRDGGPADRLALPADGTWTVVVGPEGGFEPGEVEALRPTGLLALSRFVLRAQTAPVIAAGILVARGLHESDVTGDAPITVCESPREA
jgi:16S rRNA (uracil1498-N3)-methyltransferase